jgi:hypothetical protein
VNHTDTQLREMPRQDLIEYARNALIRDPVELGLLVDELANRLEDAGRTDDYPFNSLSNTESHHAGD